MSTLVQTWDRAADRSPVFSFVDMNLRGAGQVMFQDNPLTGLLFLIGIAWGGVASGSMEVTVGCLLGLVTSTAVAMMLGVDRSALHSGLYGYNGILVGAALATFLGSSPLMWVYVFFGAAISTVAMLAVSGVCKTWGVSALTFPFVLTTLILLLATYYFPNTGISRLPHPAIPQLPHRAAAPFAVSEFLPATFNGISQVFLVQNPITGVIFLAGLAVSSVWAAVFALGGAVIAVALAAGMGTDGALISAGLFGFSPALTAIAIGTVFYSPGMRVCVATLLATIFTVIVQASLNVIVAPFGIPTLTMPFCIATWLFLLPKDQFAPVPHREIQDGAL
jgi:urea transporter